MNWDDFVDGVLALAVVLVVAAGIATFGLILWAAWGEPRPPFVERANKACIEHHGVRSADAEFGTVVCRDGWAVKP